MSLNSSLDTNVCDIHLESRIRSTPEHVAFFSDDQLQGCHLLLARHRWTCDPSVLAQRISDHVSLYGFHTASAIEGAQKWKPVAHMWKLMASSARPEW